MEHMDNILEEHEFHQVDGNVTDFSGITTFWSLVLANRHDIYEILEFRPIDKETGRSLLGEL